MEDGKHLSAEELPIIFNNEACPQMIGKPRLFFINSCDGSQNNDAISLQSDGTKGDIFPVEPKMVDEETIGSIPNDVDYLIAYASTPYAKAYRNAARGCFFVHDFCKAALSKWEEEDLEEILRGIRKDAEPIELNSKELVYQIPVVQTTLTKKIRFQMKRK